MNTTCQKQDEAQALYIDRMQSCLGMIETLKTNTDHAIHPDNITWGDCADMGRVEGLMKQILCIED